MRVPFPQHSETARFLSQSQAYRDGTETVRLRQTPTSWVFLTSRFAYKLKKPKRCGSEDFSILEQRKNAFHEELRLGRRFAPQVYLSVISVKRVDDGELSLGGAGSVVDWLLEMRRLDERQSLGWLLEVGGVRREMIESVAARLAEFYANQPPISLKTEDFIETLSVRIEADCRRLLARSADPTALEAAHRAQMEFLSQMPNRFARRVCDGRIVEGHGDLTPEHIYFDETPVLIGCITGSEEMRRSDVADDLAVLAMECDRRGAPEVGSQIKDCYVRQSGDVIDEDLFAFYKCSRAYSLAAKLATRCSRAETTEPGETERDIEHYLRIAADYAKSLTP